MNYKQILILIIILISIILFTTSKEEISVLSVKENEMYILTQEVKERRLDSCLVAQARDRAKYISKSGEFNHDNWTEWANKCKAEWRGENLTKGDRAAKDLHKALMESPAHRENLEFNKFNKIGIGCYKNICVQLFSN